MLFPGDPVAYITKQGRYGGEVGWRLVALLRIVAPFETHEAAAAAYRAGSVPVPNNCLVPGNDPVAYGLTHGVAPRETLERADPSIQPDRVIGLWDRSYAQRAAKYGTQLMCEAEFLELRQPPLLLRADLVRIFGGIPPTLNPPPIAAEQYAALAAFPVRLPADRA